MQCCRCMPRPRLNLAVAPRAALLGFNAGSYARQLEDQTDAQVTGAAFQVLQTIYGPQIPQPKDSIVTR